MTGWRMWGDSKEMRVPGDNRETIGREGLKTIGREGLKTIGREDLNMTDREMCSN